MICKGCGGVEFYKCGKCKPCSKSRVAAYHLKNKDRIAAYLSQWKIDNAEKIKHNDKIRNAAYRSANPEKRKETLCAWRSANPDKAKASAAAWKAVNPNAVRIMKHNRRVREHTNGGKLSSDLAEKLIKLQRGKCACGCGEILNDDYHLDHRMPLALGGANEDWNIQLLRSICNLKKGSKHPIAFMQSRGFLL